MGLFTPTAPLVSQLTKRSEDIASVFTRTVTDLSLVNDKADSKIQENNAAMEALKQENQSLEEITAKNKRFMGKISSFLSDDEPNV